MKLTIAIVSSSVVASLPFLFFNHHGHQNQLNHYNQDNYNSYDNNNSYESNSNYNSYNDYNEQANVPSYQNVNTETGHDDGLFTTNRDCLNNDQLRVFGIKFDFLPGIAYNQGIDINRGCGSLFNIHAINDVIRKGGDMIGNIIHPFSLFKRGTESADI